MTATPVQPKEGTKLLGPDGKPLLDKDGQQVVSTGKDMPELDVPKFETKAPPPVRMPSSNLSKQKRTKVLFDFEAENITVQNDAGMKAGQAVALRIEGNRAAFYNCAMVGFQDVLFLSGSGVKHYFKNCYIEGTTDFIFGASTAIFDSCHIHSKKNSHVTAASTNSIIPYGFVFRNCELTADSSINKVSLGRPWSPTASVTYLNCKMDKHIIADGWNNWKNPANEATARFAEYNSYGEGANPSLRVKWSKQLSEEESKNYTTEKIFGEWNPVK
jgi:pectinesterase